MDSLLIWYYDIISINLLKQLLQFNYKQLGEMYSMFPDFFGCRSRRFGCQIQWSTGHQSYGLLHVHHSYCCCSGSHPGIGHPPWKPKTEGESWRGREERRSVQPGRFLRSDQESVPREPGAGLFPTGTKRWGHVVLCLHSYLIWMSDKATGETRHRRQSGLQPHDFRLFLIVFRSKQSLKRWRWLWRMSMPPPREWSRTSPRNLSLLSRSLSNSRVAWMSWVCSWHTLKKINKPKTNKQTRD